MKVSVTIYSFGARLNKELGITGIIDKASEMGFEGIEFTRGDWTNNLDLSQAAAAREHCAEKGLEIVAYCTGADFLSPDFDGEIAHLRREVDFAAALGAPLMRHDVSHGFHSGRRYSVGYDDALPLLAKGSLEITKYAEQHGVGTMTENHGKFSQDAARVEKLINAVAHPNFGALVDVGNFMCADEDPVRSVGIMAPYAKHVHAKDFFWKSGCETDPGEGWFRTRAMNYLRGAIIGQGCAKVSQSMQILKDSGYDGYVTVEFEGMEDPLTGIRIGRDNLLRCL
jgi:sugar phosphate isomerase/epimerase